MLKHFICGYLSKLTEVNSTWISYGADWCQPPQISIQTKSMCLGKKFISLCNVNKSGLSISTIP